MSRGTGKLLDRGPHLANLEFESLVGLDPVERVLTDRADDCLRVEPGIRAARLTESYPLSPARADLPTPGLGAADCALYHARFPSSDSIDALAHALHWLRTGPQSL